MPRFVTQEQDSRPATVFDSVNEMIHRYGAGDLIRLDMGDTFLKPPDVGQPNKLNQEKFTNYNLYSETTGTAGLRLQLAQKLGDKNDLGWVSEKNIQVTCGATHALFIVFKTLLDPGDEVLVLSPRWPLIIGVLHQVGCVPVDTAFYLQPDRSFLSITACLEKKLTNKTCAIYLNSPNNPTGRVLSRQELEEIAAFAKAHSLWVVSDEAYEDFIFSDQKHVSVASLKGMESCAVSVFSFSKCLAAAGYRLGYAVAPEELICEFNRVCSYTVFNAPTDNQQLISQALSCWDDWFWTLKDTYKKHRDLFLAHFKGELIIPEGGFYAFINIEESARDFGAKEGVVNPELRVLEECIRNGVALLPGIAFGEGFQGWLRACYVAEPYERLERGVELLNRTLT